MDYILETECSHKVRRKVIEMAWKSKSSHIASALSIVDILVMLYFRYLNINPKNPYDKDRDIFILSKGHSCSALYAVLAYRGFFHIDLLEGYDKDGTAFTGHPKVYSVPGIEATTGSLGHGLPIGAGFALGSRNDGRCRKVVVLLGDGECDEGSIWESAMFASGRNLDSLIAVIDYNKLQGMGRTSEVTGLEPLNDKWRAFGWNTIEIDGHNFKELDEAFSRAFNTGNCKPTVVIAHTIKGKGISFMENKLEWHYKSPDDKEFSQALEELKY